MDERELVLFELTRFLDGFWAAGIGVSGTEVTGKLSASDEWWSWSCLKRTSSDGDGDTKSMIRRLEADVARTKVWMCSRRCLIISFPAEYESEEEERFRWFFIRILELALLRCGPTPGTLLYMLQMSRVDRFIMDSMNTTIVGSDSHSEVCCVFQTNRCTNEQIVFVFN